jgi:hypothetical protein
VLLAVALFSILGKQGCVVGVSAAYSALGAARIVGSVFAHVVGSNFFLHFGKAGLRVGDVFGIGGSIVGGNLFLHFEKAGLCRGGVGSVFGIGGSVVGSIFAGVVGGNFFLHF